MKNYPFDNIYLLVYLPVIVSPVGEPCSQRFTGEKGHSLVKNMEGNILKAVDVQCHLQVQQNTAFKIW